MLSFKDYLHQKKYNTTTITQYANRVKFFMAWTKSYGTTPATINYPTCLDYIKHLQQSNQPQSINNTLAGLKHYFNYLVDLGERADNPLEDTSVKGAIKRVVHNLLSPDELEDLYYSYETEQFNKYCNPKAKLVAKRNKVMVGLLVYQGLNTTDVKALLLEHLDIYKGKLYVPSSRRSNNRTLTLKSWQVMDLLEYINEIRPQLTKHHKNADRYLFFPKKNLTDLLARGLVPKLQSINRKVKNVRQLRASVIVNWLKQHNIRKVQYLAGHRYISSTEKYKQNDLESLQKAIESFHPMR